MKPGMCVCAYVFVCGCGCVCVATKRPNASTCSEFGACSYLSKVQAALHSSTWYIASNSETVSVFGH